MAAGLGIWRSIVQAAGRGKALMGSEAPGLVVRYVKGRMAGAGGFKGRGDGADLYYTLFGMACLDALGGPLPAGRLAAYLSGFGFGDGLDFVHLTCLGWFSKMSRSCSSSAAATPSGM